MGRSMFRSLPAVVIAVAALFSVVADASAGWRGHGGSYGGGSWGAGSYGLRAGRSYGARWGSVGRAPLGAYGSWGIGLGLHHRRSYGYRTYGYGTYAYGAYAYQPRVYTGYAYGGHYGRGYGYGSYYGGYSTAACTGTGYNYYTARPAYRSSYTYAASTPVYTTPTYSTPVYSSPAVVSTAPVYSSNVVSSTPVYSSGTVVGNGYVTGTGVSSNATLSGTTTLDSPYVGNGYVTGSVVSGEIVQDNVISSGVITGGNTICCNSGVVHGNVYDGGVIHSGAVHSHGAVISGGDSHPSVIDNGVAVPTPATEDAADEADDAAEESLPAPDDASIPSKDEAMLTISVPADAKIFVNGHETSTPGGKRTYVSRNLEDGYTYAYDVEARWVRNGETLTEKRHVDLRAGHHEKVELDFAEAIARQDAKAKKVETVVSLRVPADAKVKLAGHATKGDGPVRVFKSRSLASGQKWNDYEIQVTVNRDGRDVTKSKTITLAGGEDRNFVFDFNVNDVADNR